MCVSCSSPSECEVLNILQKHHCAFNEWQKKSHVCKEEEEENHLHIEMNIYGIYTDTARPTNEKCTNTSEN